MMVVRAGHGLCGRVVRLSGATVYRRTACLVGLLACVGVLAVGASPASAIVIHLKTGKELGYQPIFGQGAKSNPVLFDSAFKNLDYSGGPVMPSNTNYTIFWAPSNYSGAAFQTGTTASQNYVNGVNQYFTDLAADHGKSTNADAVSTQYNDASGQTAAYSSTFGGTFTDTDPLPTNGCSAGTFCLTDAQLQSELDTFLTAHSLPRDLTHEYYILTPPDLVSCFDSSNSACSANATTGAAFCAYHSYSTTSSPFVYANIPDLTGVFGCDPYTFLSPCDINFCTYPNSFADGMLTAISHEHNESITDPQPNNAWTDWESGCPFGDQTCTGEIGDKCNGDEASGVDPNEVDNTQADGFTDAPYNQTLNGHNYWLQPEYSNQTHQCLDTFTANSTTVHASFTQTVGTGNNVSFNAGGSTVNTGGTIHYVWQFNDDVTPGDTPQVNTVETTSPTISHTFPVAGAYTVALTVMASDGTSNGTAHAVETVSPPTNNSPPTISGTPQQGQALAVTNGGWTGDPTSFSHQWEDCDASGSSCAPIGGATAQTYTLGAGDVGHTIRVTETASNSAGTGGPVQSLPTAAITALPPPPPGGAGGTTGTSGAGGSGTTTAGAVGLGSPQVSGRAVNVVVACAGASGATCSVTLKLIVVETIKGGKVIAVSSRAKKRTVVLGSASVTLTAGHSASVHVVLNRAGKVLLAKRHVLRVKLAALQGGRTIATWRVVFRSKRKH
jgi:PKD domain-containing protein